MRGFCRRYKRLFVHISGLMRYKDMPQYKVMKYVKDLKTEHKAAIKKKRGADERLFSGDM